MFEQASLALSSVFGSLLARLLLCSTPLFISKAAEETFCPLLPSDPRPGVVFVFAASFRLSGSALCLSPLLLGFRAQVKEEKEVFYMVSDILHIAIERQQLSVLDNALRTSEATER